MSSCGLVTKRYGAGGLLAMRGCDGEVTSIIDGLLSKDCTESHPIMVDGGESWWTEVSIEQRKMLVNTQL